MSRLIRTKTEANIESVYPRIVKRIIRLLTYCENCKKGIGILPNILAVDAKCQYI